MQTSILRVVYSLTLAIASSVAVADPEEIDILGLIPGKSSIEDLQRVTSSVISNRVFVLDIGGYKIPCMPDFVEGKLSTLGCVTGEKVAKASNQEIHIVLVKGFTAKFGSPTSTFTKQLRTPIGVQHTAEEVWWKDKVGNTLVLYSMQGRVDQGALLLTSSDRMKRELESADKKEKERRF